MIEVFNCRTGRNVVRLPLWGVTLAPSVCRALDRLTGAVHDYDVVRA